MRTHQQQEIESYQIILPADKEAGTGHLILGDLRSAMDRAMLESHNVKTIITAAAAMDLQVEAEQTRVVFPIADAETACIQAYFEVSFLTIDFNLKRGSVLVHCGAGTSRSASLVIAYYMKKFKACYNAAYRFVRKIRRNVNPNLGFELQLRKYEEKLGLSTEQNGGMMQQSFLRQIGNSKSEIRSKQSMLSIKSVIKQSKMVQKGSLVMNPEQGYKRKTGRKSQRNIMNK